MTIITWNCHGAFRTKYHAVWEEARKPDLLVIQECENPNSYPGHQGLHFSKYKAWVGDKHKGIGVFSDKYPIKIHPYHNKRYKYVVPFTVGSSKNILIAVWAKSETENQGRRYDENTLRALEYYAKKGILKRAFAVLGDFNANYPWVNRHGLFQDGSDPKEYRRLVRNNIKAGIDGDGMDGINYHEEVVKLLERTHAFRSVYHNQGLDAHSIHGRGNEKHKTLHNYAGSWHIDYIFLGSKYYSRGAAAKIASKGAWLRWKNKHNIRCDHVPVYVSFRGSL